MLVIVVLLVLLGNLRAGLIVALAIPLSMLFAGNLMLYFGIAGSLMSLGAIDFGLIVDGSVIVIENSCAAWPTPRPASAGAGGRPRRDPGGAASRSSSAWRSSRSSTCRSWRWQGVEGKMFRPMALTVIFALTGSLLLSLTATPVLASFFLRTGQARARPSWSAGRSGSTSRSCGRRCRGPVLVDARRRRLCSLACLPVGLQLGGEFIPKLDEGDLVVVLTRPPSASLDEGIADTTRLEKASARRSPTRSARSSAGPAAPRSASTRPASTRPTCSSSSCPATTGRGSRRRRS